MAFALGLCPPAHAATRYANPVLPGSYPDPSVIRDGRDYWAVATSGAWRPPFTMLHSRDLVNWRVTGSVLRRSPRWAEGRFWAPEIVRRGRGFAVYYTAARHGGRLCIGVATSRTPRRPFRDRGIVKCSAGGAIDPLPVRDEKGRLHLLWKHDANQKAGVTSILAQRLSADGLRVAGPPRALIWANEAWESFIVEAPEITRRAGAFYLLYSGGRCCGRRCNYALGAARATRLLGPWEKRRSPILRGGLRFRCPGHASAVVGPDGRPWLAYHALAGSGALDLGRSLFVDRLGWDAEGWPRVAGGEPSAGAHSPGPAQRRRTRTYVDRFRGRGLAAGWQWPFGRPSIRVVRRRGGRLELGPRRAGEPALLGRQPGAVDYTLTALVTRSRRGGRPGIAAVGQPHKALGVELRGRRAVVWRRDGKHLAVIGRGRVPRGPVTLRMRAQGRRRFSFHVRRGRRWRRIGALANAAPRWYGEVRAVLRVAGPRRARASFGRVALRPAR